MAIFKILGKYLFGRGTFPAAIQPVEKYILLWSQYLRQFWINFPDTLVGLTPQPVLQLVTTNVHLGCTIL